MIFYAPWKKIKFLDWAESTILPDTNELTNWTKLSENPLHWSLGLYEKTKIQRSAKCCAIKLTILTNKLAAKEFFKRIGFNRFLLENKNSGKIIGNFSFSFMTNFLYLSITDISWEFISLFHSPVISSLVSFLSAICHWKIFPLLIFEHENTLCLCIFK